jgi:hypothetical protein
MCFSTPEPPSDRASFALYALSFALSKGGFFKLLNYEKLKLMAIMTHGPLGTFRGPIGNIVGSTWKGKQVIRQKSTALRTHFTELQIQQQIKFSVTMKLLQPLTELVKKSFSQDPADMTRHNKAFSLNYHRAITGTYPDFKMDYSQVILGCGKLSGAANLSCNSSTDGLLRCTWTNFAFDENSSIDDKVYLVTYCERLTHWSIQMAIADRAFGFCTTQDPSLRGELLHVYLGFISVDGKLSSDSLYGGLVVMSK